MSSDVMSLPANSRAAGMARAEVRKRLRGWDGELVDVVVLLTSELVTNVVVHTASAPRLRVDRDGDGVRVTVTDASPTAPTHRRHSARAMTGRGLELLRELADDWGWDRVGDGKAVWFAVHPKQDPVPAAAVPAPARPGDAGTPSPLGRYAPAAGSAAGPDPSHPGPGRDGQGLVTVQLLGVPVRVLAASREHHDGLMREFRLLALSGAIDRDGDDAMPARLAALTRTLGVRHAVARSRPDADFDRAVELGLDTVDLTYTVPPAIVDGGRELQMLLDEADRFSRSGQLMTLPRTPVVRRFAHWYVDQFVQQVAGGPPTPWTGPLDPA